MSETNAPEPTMEEILASIRRIISEDDAPASSAAAAATSPGDPPEPPPATAQAPEPPAAHDDVLELTERVEAEPPQAQPREPEPAAAAPPPPPPSVPASLGDLDFAPPAAGLAPTPRPTPPAPSPARVTGGDEPLVGSGAAGRAADHFGALASSLVMPAAGRSLEDVVRELLRPMLKEWLDQHLPAIVEARVQDEVERISRRRTY